MPWSPSAVLRFFHQPELRPLLHSSLSAGLRFFHQLELRPLLHSSLSAGLRFFHQLGLKPLLHSTHRLSNLVDRVEDKSSLWMTC